MRESPKQRIVRALLGWVWLSFAIVVSGLDETVGCCEWDGHAGVSSWFGREW